MYVEIILSIVIFVAGAFFIFSLIKWPKLFVTPKHETIEEKFEKQKKEIKQDIKEEIIHEIRSGYADTRNGPKEQKSYLGEREERKKEKELAEKYKKKIQMELDKQIEERKKEFKYDIQKIMDRANIYLELLLFKKLEERKPPWMSDIYERGQKLTSMKQ